MTSVHSSPGSFHPRHRSTHQTWTCHELRSSAAVEVRPQRQSRHSAQGFQKPHGRVGSLHAHASADTTIRARLTCSIEWGSTSGLTVMLCQSNARQTNSQIADFRVGGREGRVAEGPTAWFLEIDLSTAGKLIQPLQLAFSGLGELLPMSCVPAQTQSRAHKREKQSVWTACRRAHQCTRRTQRNCTFTNLHTACTEPRFLGRRS